MTLKFPILLVIKVTQHLLSTYLLVVILLSGLFPQVTKHQQHSAHNSIGAFGSYVPRLIMVSLESSYLST